MNNLDYFEQLTKRAKSKTYSIGELIYYLEVLPINKKSAIVK